MCMHEKPNGLHKKPAVSLTKTDKRDNLKGFTVVRLMATRNPVNSPVEGTVVEIPLGFFSTIPGGDRRISEPSTVSCLFSCAARL